MFYCSKRATVGHRQHSPCGQKPISGIRAREHQGLGPCELKKAKALSGDRIRKGGKASHPPRTVRERASASTRCASEQRDGRASAHTRSASELREGRASARTEACERAARGARISTHWGVCASSGERGKRRVKAETPLGSTASQPAQHAGIQTKEERVGEREKQGRELG